MNESSAIFRILKFKLSDTARVVAHENVGFVVLRDIISKTAAYGRPIE